MGLDFTGQALIDRADFHDLLAAGRFDPWASEATSLHRDGFCLLELADERLLNHADGLINDLRQQLEQPLKDWRRGVEGPPRLQDGWKTLPAVREFALHATVLEVLRVLYGREPFAFQTLNFAVGSQQHFHSDAVHFHSYPHGFMCGVWLALEDVRPGSGPLIYFPGSHRLAYRSAATLGLSPEQVQAEPHPQRFFEPSWRRDVKRTALKQKRFLPRKGQALIWHANLLHGGMAVKNRTTTRWSQVTHFFFADCLYTCLLYTSPSPRDATLSRMPSSA